MAQSIYTLAQEIVKIVSIDLNVDWSWYHDSIVNIVEAQYGFVLKAEIDTDILNAKKVTMNTVVEWLENSIN